MNWLEVNHTALRYEWRPGAGPVLVLIHEMGGSLENWETVCQALPDFQVLRYDTRCAGLSQKPVGELSIDEHVADLAALLDALDIQGPLAVAGIAVGAAIAIRFAARYPQRVSHLLAMAPAFVLGQLCDVVDLDGPIFLAQDRTPSMTYANGTAWSGDNVWGATHAAPA